MIVFLPTYKRPDVFSYVLQSALSSDVTGINERILILVLNNHYSDKDIIDRILSNTAFHDRFEYNVVHRKEKMVPTESWHLAIFDYAVENEIVCVVGDDDILMPWGLKYRYNNMIESNADMLITDFSQTLFFFENGKKCFFNSAIPKAPKKDIDFFLWDGSPPFNRTSFVSIHTYRNSIAFRRGLDLAKDWSKAQVCVPYEIATGNTPFYTPYALMASGGQVIQCDQKDVLRGRIFEEIQYSDYADGGNTAFYGLLMYDTFSNEELHVDIDKFFLMRAHFKRSFIVGVLSILVNNKIPVSLLINTMRHSGITLTDFFNWASLNNLYSILRMIPGIRGYRSKKIAKSDKLELTNEFLDYIKLISD